jgi:uncharacterized protein
MTIEPTRDADIVRDSSAAHDAPSHDGPADQAARTNLAFALRLSREEERLRAALLDWMPSVVFDVHVHANGRHTVGELSDYGWKQVRSSFPTWSIRDSAAVRDFLYGSRTVRMLRFAQPYKGIDHAAANAYLLANRPPGDAVALCGLPDDTNYTVGELKSSRYVALKMYPHYFEPPATTILGYFTPETVEAVPTGLPLILHLPRPLADCVDELLRFIERFPDTRIVLAHLGRQPTATTAARRAFRLISTIPTLAMDCSMASNVQIHRLALTELGPDRIIFGSDEPMNLLRYSEFQHPERGRRFISRHPYHWLEPEMYQRYRHLAKGAVLLHFAVIRALRNAISDVCPGDAEQAADSVFRANALRWFPHWAAMEV